MLREYTNSTSHLRGNMFKKTLEQVVTYEAGKPIELVVREFGIKPSEIIKLGSNENPYGTSPRVSFL